MRVVKQSTEAFSPDHGTRLTTHCSLRRDATVQYTPNVSDFNEGESRSWQPYGRLCHVEP